jgi:hypothetical protein
MHGFNQEGSVICIQCLVSAGRGMQIVTATVQTRSTARVVDSYVETSDSYLRSASNL